MINYKKLFHYMLDKDLPKSYLHNDVGIGWTTIAKLSNNERVRMDILEKICIHFNLDIGDICEIKKDPST